MDESGRYETVEGYPPAPLVRGEISFDDLPEVAKKRLLEVYRETWNL